MTDLFEYGEAIRRRNEGMTLAASHSPSFGEAAYIALIALAQRKEFIHIDDFLRAFPERPNSPNAMGSVWQRAIKNKIIKHSGRVAPCRTEAKKHAHQYPIYCSLIFKPITETSTWYK